VQVIQYVEGGTGSADRFGFEEVDGGFTQEPAAAEAAFPTEDVSPVSTTSEAIKEPTLQNPSSDNKEKSDDISGIIDKWGTKD
jgi:hypothetical protein